MKNQLKQYMQDTNTNAHQVAQQTELNYYRLYRLSKMEPEDFKRSVTWHELEVIQDTLDII